MDNNLHISLDNGSWAELRALRAAVGAPLAIFGMMKLFVDLGYQAHAGRPLGLLDANAEKFTRNEFAADWPGDRSAIEDLKASGFLVERAPEGLYCPLFARLNPHLESGFKPGYIRGNAVSAFVRGQKKYSERVMEFALMVPSEVWMRPDGSKMDHEEIRDAMMLIRGCDNALGKPERPQNGMGFNVGLAQAAYAVMKEFPADRIDVMLRLVLENRTHSAMPRTTEQLLGLGTEGKSRLAELSATLMQEKGRRL